MMDSPFSHNIWNRNTCIVELDSGQLFILDME